MEEKVVARVPLPKQLWNWVRGQALLEGITSGQLVDEAIREYRAKKTAEQFRRLGEEVSRGGS